MTKLQATFSFEKYEEEYKENKIERKSKIK